MNKYKFSYLEEGVGKMVICYLKSVLLFVFLCLMNSMSHAQIKTFNLDFADQSYHSPPGSWVNPGNPKETLSIDIPARYGAARFCNPYSDPGYRGMNGASYVAGNRFYSENDEAGTYKVTRTYNVQKGAKTYISTTMYSIATAPLWQYSSLSAKIDGMDLGTVDRSNSDGYSNPKTSIDKNIVWYPTSDIVTLELTMYVQTGTCFADEQYFQLNGFYQFVDLPHAVNDMGVSVPALVGGVSVVNVLANDTYGTNPATLTNTRLKQISSTNSGVTLDVTTGSVKVASGTPAGNYSLVYRLCQTEVTLDANCEDATVTVPVLDPSVGIKVSKVLRGYRGSDKDQFTVQIKSGSVVASESSTEGVGNAISQGTGTTATFAATNGVSYSVNEIMATGSLNPLSQYTSSLSCTNNTAGGSNVSGIKNSTDTFVYATGDAISCIFTNASITANNTSKITVTKRLGGRGPVYSYDQFYFGIFGINGVPLNYTTSTGSGKNVNVGTITATIDRGKQVIIGETNDGEGNPYIQHYSTSTSCTNALSIYNGGVDVSNVIAGKYEWGGAPILNGTVLGPLNGDDINCVITNDKLIASLRVTQVISAGSGTGPFVFNYSATNGWGSHSVTSVSTGTPGTASADFDLAAPAVDTILNVDVKPGWKLVSGSCKDNNTYSNTNSTSTFGTVSNNTLTIPSANVQNLAALNCTVTLGLAAPTLSVSKALTSGGRLNSKDQFTVQIKNSAGTEVGSTSLSTTGEGAVIVSGGISTMTVTANSAYTLGEAMASGSVSSLSQYGANVACTNANANGTDISTVATLTQSITLKAGDLVACIITNTFKVPTLKMTQRLLLVAPEVLTDPIEMKYVGSNGWVDQKISTPNALSVISGVAQNLSAVGTPTSLSVTRSSTQGTLFRYTCSDVNAAESGNSSEILLSGSISPIALPASVVKVGAQLVCSVLVVL